MSKERQRRRAVREAELAELAQQRAAAAAREARIRQRRRRLMRWVPKLATKQNGLLAERRSRQVRATVAVLIALNMLVFAFSRDWYLTGFTLVASVLGAPIVHMMLFRKG